MQVIINGQQHDVDANVSVSELLSQLKTESPRVAVEVNRELVRRTDFATTALSDGDQVEIVTFVGGG